MPLETLPFDAAEFFTSEEAQRELLSEAIETGDAEFTAAALRTIARAQGTPMTEDEVDLRIFDEIQRKLASGEDEIIPPNAVKRLDAGESPVRVWRELRGMSVEELAAKAGVSQPYLSQIEKGERDGTFKTMKNIADALGVTLDDLT